MLGSQVGESTDEGRGRHPKKLPDSGIKVNRGALVLEWASSLGEVGFIYETAGAKSFL